jgi:hypothetical protein
MADGVRIQLTAERMREVNIDSAANRLITVRDVGRPMISTAVCNVCHQRHDCKTYHFQMDADGTKIVSTTIWDNLQKMYDHGGFEMVNVVAHPPAQGIVLPTAVVRVQPARM